MTTQTVVTRGTVSSAATEKMNFYMSLCKFFSSRLAEVVYGHDFLYGSLQDSMYVSQFLPLFRLAVSPECVLQYSSRL
jgi:hypothetical protein